MRGFVGDRQMLEEKLILRTGEHEPKYVSKNAEIFLGTVELEDSGSHSTLCICTEVGTEIPRQKGTP